MMVDNIFTEVLFPAPLGPSKPTISPSPTSKVRPSKALIVLFLA